jgi:hypothetical protein
MTLELDENHKAIDALQADVKRRDADVAEKDREIKMLRVRLSYPKPLD